MNKKYKGSVPSSLLAASYCWQPVSVHCIYACIQLTLNRLKVSSAILPLLGRPKRRVDRGCSVLGLGAAFAR